jgi:hypothetical protein
MKRVWLLVLLCIPIVFAQDLSIHTITAPANVSYTDEFVFSFILEPTSETVTNVSISLQNHQKDLFAVPELAGPQNFSINLVGDMLHSPVIVEVQYQGIEGESLLAEEIPITLTDASFWQRTRLFFRGVMTRWFG